MTNPANSGLPVYTERPSLIGGGHRNGCIATAVQRVDDPAIRRTMLTWIPWRAAGCDIYACIDPEDVEGVNDERIGSMTSERLASEAVMAHNVSLRNVDDR